MIFDGISYREYALSGPQSPWREAALSFVAFVERKLGMVAMYPLSGIPRGRAELIEPYAAAQALVRKGLIRSFKRVTLPPDEPAFRFWQCACEDSIGSSTSGMSLRDADALYAALAEALERYLWMMQWDHFDSPVRATAAEMTARGTAHIAPERFSGFDAGAAHEAEASYTWILGDSLVSGTKIYIPAQTGSGAQFPGIKLERLFRERSTNGLATWPTRNGARLAGILELIERDAYIIMWLNQLTLPKAALAPLAAQNAALSSLLERCARYGFKVHALPMPTDAPTYAVCVIVEDLSGIAPRFALGMKAHRSLSIAVEKALLEALRARISYRSSERAIGQWDPNTPADKVGHADRLYYWGLEKHASGLEFLIRGKEEDSDDGPWKNDSADEHLARLVGWCREKSYECVAVALTGSSMNPLPWHIEAVVMPDLQWMHLTEKRRVLAGRRLSEVPRLLGLSPRAEPFSDEPHPFY